MQGFVHGSTQGTPVHDGTAVRRLFMKLGKDNPSFVHEMMETATTVQREFMKICISGDYGTEARQHMQQLWCRLSEKERLTLEQIAGWALALGGAGCPSGLAGQPALPKHGTVQRPVPSVKVPAGSAAGPGMLLESAPWLACGVRTR